MITNTQPARSIKASGELATPSCAAAASSSAGERDKTRIATDASSQLTEYSTRMCARRTEASTSTIRSKLIPVVKFKRRSIRHSSSKTRQPQDVHENTQQHMNYIVNGFEGRNGRFARPAGVKTAGDFLEAEGFPLQHHQRFNFRIFQWEAPAEDLQRIAVDADEARG